MKVAAGKLAKSMVFKGSRVKTVGGLKQADIIKNRNGRVVSKAMSVRSKKSFKGGALEAWMKAVQAAKKAMGITGFVLVGGKSGQGKELHAKAKALYSKK